MPNTVSAKKRLRQSETRRLQNRSVRSSMRTQIRKFRDALKENNLDVAKAEFRVVVKKLDQAAAKNLIHRNAASRTKSRLNAVLKTAVTAG